jgi:hypothetical protein
MLRSFYTRLFGSGKSKNDRRILSVGTQIEGAKDTRPFRNVRPHFGVADGMRHRSIRSPQPQGQESIGYLYLPGFPTRKQRKADRRARLEGPAWTGISWRWSCSERCATGSAQAPRDARDPYPCHSIPRNGCWSPNPSVLCRHSCNRNVVRGDLCAFSLGVTQIRP